MGPPLHAKVNGCDVWLTKDEADHNVVCIGIHGLIRSEAVRKTDERWDPEMIPAMPTSPLSAIKMLIVLSLLQNMMVCVMDISSLFYRFSHCQDRALERDRPQQRKKTVFRRE